MKIKISKDYDIWETVRKDDYENGRWSSITKPSEYHTWETIDVTEEKLLELIKQGHAIMINC